MKASKQKGYNARLRHLIDVGVALSSEKELGRLLEMILKYAFEVSPCESVHIYLIREEARHEKSNVISLQKKSILYFLKSLNRAQVLGTIKRVSQSTIQAWLVFWHNNTKP